MTDRKRISLDNMLGKALCILLVVILTVGAFLAPKMINNLYDAGTLMQITYMDLDLSTYAVAYTSFPEKIEAIARAKAAGEKLSVLSSEETDEKLSGEELVEITNREMEDLKDSVVMLFWEEWWSGLSEENLVSREKNTLYAQPGEAKEGASGSEMAPVQFWTLTFELTEEQKVRQEEEYTMMLEGIKVTTWPPYEYTAEKLIVCLDADFYKIYSIGIEGKQEKVWMQYEAYGWEFPEIFGMSFYSEKDKEYVETPPDSIGEIQMYLTDNFLVDWSTYWGVRPEDESVYGTYTQGEIVGYLVLPNEREKEEDSADAQKDSEVVIVAGSTDKEVYDADVSYAGGNENRYANQSIESQYTDWNGEDRMLLAVGCVGQWDGEDNELWIQRGGCREFFEMMQF